MARKQPHFQRPILMGGLGLSATLWLVDTLQFQLFDGSTLLAALALGSGVWWSRKLWPKAAEPFAPVPPPPTDRAAVEASLGAVGQMLDQLATELAAADLPLDSVPPLRHALAALTADLDRTALTVALVGEPYSGKTTLQQALQGENPAWAERLTWVELALPTASGNPEDGNPEGGNANHEQPGSEGSPTDPAWDGVLLVTSGDLTATAWAYLERLVAQGQGVGVVFSQCDRPSPAAAAQILGRLRDRCATLGARVPVVAAAAAPQPLTVRQVQADGSIQERQTPQPPQLAELQQIIEQRVLAQAPQRVFATVQRQSDALRRQGQQALNQVRRQRALPLIEQLQWVAAAAAFANPVATLDLLATVAISGQLMVDLAGVYGFSLSLADGQAAASALAGLVVKLGLVEVASQALALVLKSHGATYLAGGLLQGISAAYLTRMVGLSLADHFEAAALAGRSTRDLSWDAVAQGLQARLGQMGQGEFLQTLVRQGMQRLRPEVASALEPS